ncbi:MAG: FMN-binding negative transcriptional regulator [Gammaproteobacteria bacterium]|nr:FMN-binding negative transcriptional regulator [Gammaproteobacteria bacterium]
MYKLPYHKENDPEVVRALMREFPFAFLTACDSMQRPVVTQVPLFYEESGDTTFLRGHMMRNTDHHKAFKHNSQALAVFTGRHSYVSATWYSNPNTASTWNYMSVHVRGELRFLEGDALEEMLRKTSLHFENNDHESPTVFDNLPDSFRRKVMKAIVAFEIEIAEIDNVFKLSQDRDFKSYQNIISELEKQGVDGDAIAQEMKKRIRKVFPDS